MKIVIDYTLATNNQGGMAMFVKDLAKSLILRDKKNSYNLISYNYPKVLKGKIFKLTSIAKEHIWYQLGIIKEVRKLNADFILYPNPPISLFLSIPAILNIPDTIFLFDKELNILAKAYLFLTYFLAAHKSKIITTFSMNSKRDIVRYFKVSPNKVHVLYIAASDVYHITARSNVKATLNKFGISKKYILSNPGTFLKRKNTEDLLLSYKHLPKKIRNNISLVIIGKANGPYFEDIIEKIKFFRLTNNVIITGYVSDQEFSDIMKCSYIFINTSLYEGFGLAPLQAMTCGIPVVVYNRTSLPEVVGDGGLIVNNENELTQAIQKLINDKHLYKTLIKKGKKRSKFFSWDKYVKQFQSLL